MNDLDLLNYPGKVDYLKQGRLAVEKKGGAAWAINRILNQPKIAMKKTKFTGGAQPKHSRVAGAIVFALKQAETGVAVAEVCQDGPATPQDGHQIHCGSEATFYNWKKSLVA